MNIHKLFLVVAGLILSLISFVSVNADTVTSTMSVTFTKPTRNDLDTKPEYRGQEGIKLLSVPSDKSNKLVVNNVTADGIDSSFNVYAQVEKFKINGFNAKLDHFGYDVLDLSSVLKPATNHISINSNPTLIATSDKDAFGKEEFSTSPISIKGSSWIPSFGKDKVSATVLYSIVVGP